MTRETILTVPWVLLEVELEPVAMVRARTVAPDLPLAAEPRYAEPVNDAIPSRRPFYVTLGASVVWCIVAAVMILTGAMFPIDGNVLAYLVLMAGLFCAAFMALTYPRPDGEEEFITLGWYTVGQCTPSRGNTLTGRGDQ